MINPAEFVFSLVVHGSAWRWSYGDQMPGDVDVAVAYFRNHKEKNHEDLVKNRRKAVEMIVAKWLGNKGLIQPIPIQFTSEQNFSGIDAPALVIPVPPGWKNWDDSEVYGHIYGKKPNVYRKVINDVSAWILGFSNDPIALLNWMNNPDEAYMIDITNGINRDPNEDAYGGIVTYLKSLQKAVSRCRAWSHPMVSGHPVKTIVDRICYRTAEVQVMCGSGIEIHTGMDAGLRRHGSMILRMTNTPYR